MGYDLAAWSDFWVAMAGASAALTGLLVVAVSINLEQILGFPLLPLRAAETLGLLVALLVASVFGLVPGGRMTLGVAPGVGLALGGVDLWRRLRRVPSDVPRMRAFGPLVRCRRPRSPCWSRE